MELKDLDEWLRLDLVPVKDRAKHQNEIETVRKKVEDEKERLRHLKESGETEGYAMPKRGSQARATYQDAHTMSGMETENIGNVTESGFETDGDTSYDTESGATVSDEEGNPGVATREEDGDDPFSDKNRWRRGILEDPDADSW